MCKLYYTPPSDECFEDLKQAAIKVWNRYVDEPNYVKEKVDMIKDVKNIKDNFMFILGMFDCHNQRRVANHLTTDTINAINERLIDGGSPEFLLI